MIPTSADRSGRGRLEVRTRAAWAGFCVLILVIAGLLGSCSAPEPVVDALDADAAVSSGLAHAQQLERLAAAGRGLDGEGAVELAYLERLRLGLGSPFRLVELALEDTRLPLERRRRLAAALLGRTARGESYRVSPLALGPMQRTDPSESGAAAVHLRLISEAVREADDPRAGELAVRLAYLLASAEWTLSEADARLAMQVAGLVRDRELARADARRLLRTAERSGADVFALLRSWRAQRLFAVEAPTAVGPGHAAERYAMRLAPHLAETLRDIAAGGGPAEPAFRGSGEASLRAGPARALLTDSAGAPPQAPIAVMLSALARDSMNSVGRDDPARSVLLAAKSEERFAATYALLRAERRDLSPVMERTVVWVATAMRPLGQERVGSDVPVPSARELVNQFGLAAVEFDPAVPAEWRAHYRRVLHSALLDMQRVLPALRLRGLTIRVGPVPGGQALALHDPRTRTIHFPPESGVGTLAHEIAHDLDWQVALRRYNVRGDYGSDRAVRRPTDRLAATFQGLTGAVLSAAAPVSVDHSRHQARPAEIFARSVDWLVATSLAREGRMNGYLSSVQDDLLTGYGTVVSPDITGRAGEALIDILDEVAPLHAGNRAWFLASYGPGRAHTATDLVRQVTRAGVQRDSTTVWAGTRAVPADSARLVEAAHSSLSEPLRQLAQAEAEALHAVCTVPGAAFDPSLIELRRTLIEQAVAARARGLVKRHAARMLGHRGVQWVEARFGPGPWPTPADTLRLALVETLVAEWEPFRRLDGVPGSGADPFRLLPETDACGGFRAADFRGEDG